MAARLRGLARSLYRGEQQFDFPRLWRRSLVLSLAAVALSIASFAVRGLDLGIEFQGGTAWEVSAPGVSVAEARDALRDTGAADARIQTIGGDAIRVRAGADVSVDEVRGALAELAGADDTDVSVTTVGPSWGSEITAKARNALLAFFALVAAYIAVRLEWKMAVGALAAVAHDIIITVGFYSVFQFEITPATVIAFLTIMGYSLYDTIVVYDKVREVVGRVSATGRYTYTEMMNLALNRVLMRSVNTSVTSMLPVASMLVIGSFVLGAVTLQEFAVALMAGIAVGTYSSVFIAATLVAWMKEREPDYIEIAEKVRRRHGRAPAGTRAVSEVDAVFGDVAVPQGRLRARVSGAAGPAARGAATPGSARPSRQSGARRAAGPASPQRPRPAPGSSAGRPGPSSAARPAIPPRPRKKKRKKR